MIGSPKSVIILILWSATWKLSLDNRIRLWIIGIVLTQDDLGSQTQGQLSMCRQCRGPVRLPLWSEQRVFLGCWLCYGAEGECEALVWQEEELKTVWVAVRIHWHFLSFSHFLSSDRKEVDDEKNVAVIHDHKQSPGIFNINVIINEMNISHNKALRVSVLPVCQAHSQTCSSVLFGLL